MAHAYTRYLGDLSGGQVLGRITQKSLKLSSSDGVSFFTFPGVSSPSLFKQLYRSRMNSVELTEEQRSEVLQEAVRSFEYNIQVGAGSCRVGKGGKKKKKKDLMGIFFSLCPKPSRSLTICRKC